MKNKRLVAGVAVAVTAAIGLAIQFAPQQQSAVSSPDTTVTAQKTPQSSSFLASLPERDAIGKSQGELFGPRSWAAALPALAARQAVVEAPPAPTAPAIPYRIAGQVVAEDGTRVVLTKGDRVFEVREGQTLEEGFRLESISAHALKFVYVPLGIVQEMPVVGFGLDLPVPARNVVNTPETSPATASSASPAVAGAPPAAAQLRFAGPQEVRAGTPFEVALKLTSVQPVQAMPMQLTYDAKRLQPVSVRAGDLFPGGNFTYRVNPNGSIFVGASGSGRTASDTDSLIVTFRPIASGSAELKVSSLLLQGAAGGTIAHEPPAAFYAAILK